MSRLPKELADVKLGGLTALAKAQAAIVLNECAQCAQLLFGGNGYTQTGQGELIEKISREVAGARIPVRLPCSLTRMQRLSNNSFREAARMSCLTWLSDSSSRTIGMPPRHWNGREEVAKYRWNKVADLRINSKALVNLEALAKIFQCFSQPVPTKNL